MTDLYYLGNSRSDVQTERMIMLEDEGACIFCPESFGHRDIERPMISIGSWNVFPNRWPYAGTKVHLLIAPSEHVCALPDLSPRARLDYWDVLDWFATTYKPEAFGHFSRNGDNAYTGGTIAHFHGHLTISDPESDDAVRAKLSSKPLQKAPASS